MYGYECDVCILSMHAGSALIQSRYHTISNHSPLVNRIGNKLDYVGIVMLITGSFIPSIWFGFWCDPMLQRIYWTMVCMVSSKHRVCHLI
jgi:adiponectin receptor